MQADVVGWLASSILVATLSRQIWKQWKSTQVEGVSTWLFTGQISASILFVIYSALVGSAVFVVTNALILVTAVVGQVVSIIRRRQQRERVTAREQAGIVSRPKR